MRLMETGSPQWYSFCMERALRTSFAVWLKLHEPRKKGWYQTWIVDYMPKGTRTRRQRRLSYFPDRKWLLLKIVGFADFQLTSRSSAQRRPCGTGEGLTTQNGGGHQLNWHATQREKWNIAASATKARKSGISLPLSSVARRLESSCWWGCILNNFSSSACFATPRHPVLLGHCNSQTGNGIRIRQRWFHKSYISHGNLTRCHLLERLSGQFTLTLLCHRNHAFNLTY